MDDRIVPPETTRDVERFDRWAATYDRSILQRLYFGPVHSRMLDLLMHETTEKLPTYVVDVGCGTGRLLRAASDRWPQARLVGFDPAAQMVSQAARLSPNAAFTRAPAEALPLPDESADIVLSSISFHHWADQERGLREIARVLRTGGLFCLADHTFGLGKLFGEKVRNAEQVRALVTGAGLPVRRRVPLRWRFILITLAQKGPPVAS